MLDLSSPSSRRDFLSRAGGVAGTGLVHFAILGSLATPAYAETDDECATEGCDDQQFIDVCNCKENDDGTPPRDNCNCPTGDDGDPNPVEDVCQCGDEVIGGASDVCGCGKDTSEVTDYCTCADDRNDFPSDECVPGGCYDVNWGCSVQKVDYHTDAWESADVCKCFQDVAGMADACKCWWDGNPGQGGTADYCDCKATDASGHADCCACCTDHPNVPGGTQADYCNCPEDHNGSICYDEGGNPALADWCNCDKDTNVSDICGCQSNDQNSSTGSHTTTQADMCCLKELFKDGSGHGPSQPPSGDVCTSCKDGDVGSHPGTGSGGWDATDYCPDGSDAEDSCVCTENDQGQADVCDCGEDLDDPAEDVCTCGEDKETFDVCDCNQDQNAADYCDCPGDQGVADV